MLDRNECETQLIAYAVDKGDMSVLTAEGIEPSYFEAYSELATRLFNKYEESKRVPSRKMVKEKYPDVFLPQTDERDFPEYAESLREHHAKARMRDTFEKVRKMFLSDDWKKVLDETPDALTDIKQVLDRRQIDDLVGKASDRYELFQRQTSGEEIYPTRFAHPDLNDYVGGMKGGDVITILADSGQGKSWDAILNTFASWENGASALIVSLEMSATKLGYRFDSIATAGKSTPGFSNYALSRGYAVRDTDLDPDQTPAKATEYFAEEYKRYIEKLELDNKDGTAPSIYVVTPNNAGAKLTPDYIHSLAKSLKVDMVVVDQLMLVPRKSNQEVRHALAEIIYSFKDSAQELDIPYIVPHQLNRDAASSKQVGKHNVAESYDVIRASDISTLFEKTGNFVSYKLLKTRDGPSEKTFGWTWSYDSGIRHVVPFSDIAAQVERESGSFANGQFEEGF